MVRVEGERPFRLFFGCRHTRVSEFLPGGRGAGWQMPEDVPFSDLTLVIKESGATDPPLFLRVHKVCLSRSEYFKVSHSLPSLSVDAISSL
jgi:hypothetical protein